MSIHTFTQTEDTPPNMHKQVINTRVMVKLISDHWRREHLLKHTLTHTHLHTPYTSTSIVQV